MYLCLSVYPSLCLRVCDYVRVFLIMCVSVGLYVRVYEYVNLYHRHANHVRMGSWFARHSSSTMGKAMVEIVSLSVSGCLCHFLCL